jgi:hypothetical protein
MDISQEIALHGIGKFCSIMILAQDGPLNPEVARITETLVELVDECWAADLINRVTRNVAGRKLGRSLEAAGIGTELHYRLFELALEAQKRRRLPFELDMAATVGRPLLPQRVHPTKGKAKKLRTVGPDFVLRGRVGGEQVDAAWELTTNPELASHYDRDIGNKKKGKQEPDYSAEIGVREHDDRSSYWSSYIAICY